jgi:WD40 repeat protein/tRNA A-37 threonylcarbamoyl transferase component Bud32/uncharacterized protein YoxC
MEPITTFLTTTIVGNIIVGALGESLNGITVGKFSDFWNELNIGNHDLQNAFTGAYEHTIVSIEMVLTPRDGLKGFLNNILPKKKREKELAEDFSEKVLYPFLQKKNLTGKRKDDFLKASRKACQYLLKQKDTILNFEELLTDMRKEKDVSPSLMNEAARETFHLVEAILFTGQDLSDAPELEKTRSIAGEVIFKRLKDKVGKEIEGYFELLNLETELFYSFLKEDDLFLNGLVFNIDLAIKNNQKVANILQSYRNQEEIKDRETYKNEKIKERDDLLEKITKIEQAMELMRQAGLDGTPMKSQLEPLQNEVAKIDTIMKRSEKWMKVCEDINSHMESFRDYMGGITEIMEELGEKMETLLGEIRKMDETIGEVSVTVKETKTAVSGVDKKVDFIIELLQGFQRDSHMSDNQRESLIAGLDAKDFDLHYLYDFSETREYELGRGAVGIVYRAVHKGTKEPCALKILKEEYRENHTVVARFLREGAILKGLKHENIVKVEEVGGGGKDLNFYIHMELLHGFSLRKLIDEKSLPREWDKLKDITLQFLRGIEVIHKNGIIHRDINPNNIILTPDWKVKLMDFGVAKIIGLSGLTRHGEVIGTSRYMSPEQERGESLDQRSDIYCAGLVLYELYTYRIAGKPLKSIRFYNPSAPEWIDTIIAKCLSSEKGKRYFSVEKILKAIEGHGSDPQDIKKYKNQLYVVYEDGKITKRENALLSDLREELSIPENVSKILEEEVKKDIVTEKLEEGYRDLQKGDYISAEYHFKVVLLLDSASEKAKKAIEEVKKAKGLHSPVIQKTEAVSIQSCFTGKTSETPEIIKPSEIQPVEIKISPIQSVTIQPVTIQPSEDISGIPATWKEILLYSNEGHNNRVNSVIFSGDGKYIVSGGLDNTIRISEFTTGREIRKIHRYGMAVTALAMTSDNSRIIASSIDNKIYIYKFETGKEIKILQGHKGAVFTISMSPDDKYIVSGSADKTLKLWDGDTGQVIRNFEGHTEGVTFVSFISDGTYIVSGSRDKTIRIWETSTGKELKYISGHINPVISGSVSQNNRYIATCDTGGTIIMWDLSTGREIMSLTGHKGNVYSVSFSYDCKYMVSAGSDRTVRLWDINKEVEVLSFEGHTSEVLSAVISQDNRYVISGGNDGTVRIWSIEEKKEVRVPQGHFRAVKSLAITGDNRYVLTGSEDNTIRIWNIKEGKEIKKLVCPRENYIQSISLSSDGKYIVSSGTSGVELWDFTTGEQVQHIITGMVTSSVITSDNKYIVCTSSFSNDINVYEIESKRIIKTFKGHTENIRSVAITSDNKYVVSGALGKIIRLWDFDTGREIKRFEGHSTGVISLFISSDNKYLISGGIDSTVISWDMATGKKLKVFTGHTGQVKSVYLSCDNNFIISASTDGTVRVWSFNSGKESNRFTGHTGEVSCALMTSDNKYIISSGQDKTVRILGGDVKKREEKKEELRGIKVHHELVQAEIIIIKPDSDEETSSFAGWKEIKILGSIEGHNNIVSSVSLSGDGKYIFSGSYDQTIRIWDFTTGKEIKKLYRIGAGVSELAPTQDGKYVACASTDGKIYLWNIEKGEIEKTFSGHTGAIQSMALSYDNRYIVSGSQDKSVRMWELEKGVEVRKLDGHSGNINFVSISSDNRYIISASADKTIRIWDSSSGQEIRYITGHINPIISGALSADNKYMASGDTGGAIILWDVVSGDEIINLKGHNGPVHSISFSPDRRYLISGGSDRSIRIWNIQTGQELKSFECKRAGVKSAIMSGDNRYVISGNLDGTIRLWDIEGGNELRQPEGHFKPVRALAVSNDNRTVITGAEDNTIIIWDLISGKQLKELIYKPENYYYSLRLTKDEKIISSGTSGINFWDITTGETVGKNLGGSAMSFDISHDEKYIVVASSFQNDISLYEMESRKVIKKFKGHSSNLRSVCFSRDGKFILSGSLDRTIRLWDVNTGEEVRRFEGHNGGVMSISISKDGRYFVSGGTDSVIIIWEIETGKKVKVLTGHNGMVNAVSLSEDNKLIVSASSDSTVRLWSFNNGRELKRFAGHTGEVYNALITSDGKYIISTGQDKTLRIWGELS